MNALLDSRLADCRRIFLHEFSLEVSIGFHDFELEAPQRVIIDVDLFVPIAHSTSPNDHVAEVLDYDFIRQGVTEWARSRHFNLQETLVDGIVALCLAQPAVCAVKVRAQKPDVYPDCRSVGVEVFRFRAGL